MGRGIVHPVDAMHTRPWNEDLLDYLAVHLVDEGYDLKQTMYLICTSEAYQSATPTARQTGEGGSFVFHGPAARRLTAEQFMDKVWQLTGAAPVQYDAQVVRVSIPGDQSESGDRDEDSVQSADDSGRPQEVTAKWIWSYDPAGQQQPADGETISCRYRWKLDAIPARAFAGITCDNEYTMYVNGRRVIADGNWETVELVSLISHLKTGDNELLIVAKNAGNGPNPAGLMCEVRTWSEESGWQVIGTGTDWEVSKSSPNANGRFAQEPDDWQPAIVLSQPVWNARVMPQLTSMLLQGEVAEPRMVRASLVKADELMRALGRPNRDQIVTMRPNELTTLEAINLANGQRLADAIATGGDQLSARFADDSEGLTEWIFQHALSRNPTPDEREITRQLLGDHVESEPVQDLLWAIIMLPEFQLVR